MTPLNPAEILKQLSEIQPCGVISDRDTMFADYERHYFGVGRSALLIILAASIAKMSYPYGEKAPQKILDFGSGYGRVARYLRAGFPEATVDVTDYDQAGPKWCADYLGCRQMPDPMPTNFYDLVWLGSVFTHLSETTSRDIIPSLINSLRPLGVILFTTGGRLGASHIEGHLSRKDDGNYQSYNMTDQEITTILAGYNKRGFGYSDYHNQVGYGSALSNPTWWFKEMTSRGMVQIYFQEFAWDTHQDVYGFMKVEQNLVTFARDKGPYF